MSAVFPEAVPPATPIISGRFSGASTAPPPKLCSGSSSYCTFAVWRPAELAADRQAVPLLKFAAPPRARRDLDALRESLEAVVESAAVHVVSPDSSL